MDLAEAYITHIVTTVLAHHRADLKVIGKDISKLEAIIAPTPATNTATNQNAVILSERSESKDPEGASPAHTAETFSTTNPNASGPVTNKFPRLSYDEAHAMLEKAYAEGKIEAPHKYGDDFGSPDETYISSQFSKPVMIHRYPAAIKAFYMQPDPIDPTKALCVDVLAPEGYGEIIGGSQRVDSYDLLKQRIEDHNLPLAAFQWYLDLRKYGSVPHAGFGMGIERVVAWICGLDHVRETIPFARTLNRIYP
jgi:asparaginyl-tRNA synthetase